MDEMRDPVDLVLALVRLISGESPRRGAAEALLHPQVRIHMDSTHHRGISNWYRWIHLMRNCGRVRDLRMQPAEVRRDTDNADIVHLAMSWTGTGRACGQPRVADGRYHVRYRVIGGLIVEIWTQRRNYAFIFGDWIRSPVRYRLFLGWAVLYFALLRLRGGDFRADLARRGTRREVSR